MMRLLDLFSGIGGFSLAATWCWGDELEIVSFCEIDPFCQKILHKHWPAVPVVSDIKELHSEGQKIDIITGGFPCQPFSCIGKRKSKEDSRYLWPEMLRVIKEFKPRWIIGENVTGIIGLALEDVCTSLETEGYEVWPIIIPACAVGAPHRRDRVWFLVWNDTCYPNTSIPRICTGENPNTIRSCEKDGFWEFESGMDRVFNELSERVDGGGLDEQMDYQKTDTATLSLVWEVLRNMWGDEEFTTTPSELRKRGVPYIVSTLSYSRRSTLRNSSKKEDKELCDLWKRVSATSFDEAQNMLCDLLERIGKAQRNETMGQWDEEPDIPRVAVGVKNRANRLKSLGNAIVPQVAYEIMCDIKEIEGKLSAK